MSGVREKPKQSNQKWDNTFEQLYSMLPANKTLQKELWTETIDPLLPVEGMAEDDMEFFQYHQAKKLAGEKVATDHFTKDTVAYQKARKHAPVPQLEIKPIGRKVGKSEGGIKVGLERMKRRLKIVKRNRSRSPRSEEKIE